jgi:hypothetical protein
VAPRFADLVAAPDNAGAAGALDGAAVGEAVQDRMVVRVGLWLEGRRVRRARFRSTTCAALIAYAEAACRALERGAVPDRLDAGALRDAVSGVHPLHHGRAALVARAVHAAYARAQEARR